jgi:hypothetical protein
MGEPKLRKFNSAPSTEKKKKKERKKESESVFFTLLR